MTATRSTRDRYRIDPRVLPNAWSQQMDRVCSVSSDLGLLSEEYSTSIERLAGNYPQVFSHLGLIRAAAAISHPETPVDPEASR